MPIAAGPDDARRRGGRVPASEGSGPAIDAIVLGDLAEGFDYALLNGAFRWITDGAQLIALQRNRPSVIPPPARRQRRASAPARYPVTARTSGA